MGWREKVWEFLKDEPVYAPAKPDPYVEGWKFAYEQKAEKLKLAEKRLKSLDELATAIIDWQINPQYGHDIKTLLHMTEAELDEDYGED